MSSGLQLEHLELLHKQLVIVRPHRKVLHAAHHRALRGSIRLIGFCHARRIRCGCRWRVIEPRERASFHRLDAGIGGVVQHAGQGRLGGGHHQRFAIECPDLAHGASRRSGPPGRGYPGRAGPHEDLVETWINYKRREQSDAVGLRPLRGSSPPITSVLT